MKTQRIDIRRPFARMTQRIALALGFTALAVAACSDEPSEEAQINLASEAELFPGLEFSTGLQPPGSPVQASFTVTAKGAAKVNARAVASDAALIGLPGTGSLAIDGGFALTGQLKIAIDGFPPYDGPIPGIDNVQIAFTGETAFDPFAIGKQVRARADIPASRLPGIPLPGGLPGELVIEVADGSFVEIAFAGTCAGADDEEAAYGGTIDRGGSLVLRPLVEIEVPLLGKQAFEIPAVTVDLALGSSDVFMSAEVKEVVGSAPEGERAEGACVNDGGGGAASSSTGQSSSTAATTGAGGGTCDNGQPGDYGADDAVCASCFDCAWQSTCAAEAAPCMEGSGQPCDVFLACSEYCDVQCGGDLLCFDACLGQGPEGAALGTCIASHPAGYDQYMSFLVCSICNACPVNCNAAAYCY